MQVKTVKLNEVLKNIEYSLLGIDPETEINGITNDSRKVKPGMIFAALPGADSGIHGMTYASKALQNGAKAVLSDVELQDDLPYIRVVDSEKAYAVAAGNLEGNPAEKLKLIGVTGTNGKTTTTHLITNVLETAGYHCGLIGTNEILINGISEPSPNTTPEGPELHAYFRRMVEAGCEYCVMEVSSHSLALGRVSGLIFEVAAFTNLTQDHLNFHGTMENYAKAKSFLFQNAKNAVINIDAVFSGLMLESAIGKKKTFSVRSDCADITAKNVKLCPDRVDFTAVQDDMSEAITLHIPGLFSVENAMTTYAVCLSLGIPSETVALGIKSAKGVCGRAETVPVGMPYTVMIDYAHSPDSLENILRTVRPCTDGKVITVFGCGGDRDKGKRPIMGKIAEELSDYCFVTTDNPRTEDPDEIISQILSGMTKTNHTAVTDRTTAIGMALQYASKGDTVLIAGKGHELYQDINGVKIHYDEREIVKKALNIE